MKFSANITTLFKDIPKLSEKYVHICKAIKSARNMDAIECQNPYTLKIDEWKMIFNDCIENEFLLPKWTLINTKSIFDVFESNQIPTFDEYKEKILSVALDYSIALNVPIIHLVMCDINNSTQFDTVVELVSRAAKYFATYEKLCVIEPLSHRSNYYLRSYKTANEIIEKCGQNNLKILLDLYHMQRLNGNLTENILSLKEKIGYVQISQSPNRDAPVNDGEINYSYVLPLISKVYDNYIGLEYFNNSDESLDWIDKYENL